MIGERPHETLVWHLEHVAANAPPEDVLTLVDRRENEVSLHWSEVFARAQRAAYALWQHGIRPGDRVAIVLQTEVAFFDTFFGCQLLGAVPTPLYPPVRLGRLEEYIDRTVAMLAAVEASALVTSRRIRSLLGQVVARASLRHGVLEAGTLAEGGVEVALPTHQLDDLAMVQFSSGTTQRPKPIALTHRQVTANVRMILDFLPLDAGFKQVGGSWLPLYHDMGLIGCVFVAVMGPGPLALIPPEVFLAKPAIWLRTLAKHRVTVCPAPNFAYALCAERITDEEIAGIDLSSWRLALNGAEPVAPSSLRRFADRFAAYGLRPEALTPVYGLAEASLAVTFSDPSRPFTTLAFDREAVAEGIAKLATDPAEGLELASVGTPLRQTTVAIRNADHTDLPEGHVGRIWAQSPSVMRGYLDREEQPFREGWLDTGDLGFLWQGELYITGREKDVVIVAGQNHAAADLEIATESLPEVRTGCVVAASDVDNDGERLMMFVECRTQREGLAEDCRKAVLARTGLNPDLVLLLDPGTLPRTSSGKIRRRETVRRFKAGELSPPKQVTPWLVAGAMAKSAWGYLSQWTRT
ncbi:MAG: fatty acyl-AMP ligase [Myxococcota bacterium]